MTRQSKISAWAQRVLGVEAATNIPERALRSAEEALELAQACEVDAASVHRLVDYVYSRPVGKPAQEIAGTMVTLYAMAAAVGVDADAEFEIEVERIHRPEVIERCQRRQGEKREALAPQRPGPLPVVEVLGQPRSSQRWTVVGLYERGKYVIDTFICYVGGLSAEEARDSAVRVNAGRGDKIEVLACVAGGGVARVFQDDLPPKVQGEWVPPEKSTGEQSLTADLTKHEHFSLSYLTPNLMSVLEREPPGAPETTRALARQELAWLLRWSAHASKPTLPGRRICVKCGREEPTYISDPTCRESGYCDYKDAVVGGVR